MLFDGIDRKLEQTRKGVMTGRALRVLGLEHEPVACQTMEPLSARRLFFEDPVDEVAHQRV